MKKLIIFIVSVVIVFSACKLASPVDDTLITPDMDFGGTLSLNLNTGPNLRSVSIDTMVLDITTYTIVGTRTDDPVTPQETFTFDVSSVGFYQKSGLTAGIWEVIADGYDDSDPAELIATATVSDITVSDNNTEPVAITVEPLTGSLTSGTLSLNLHWSNTDVPLPDFTTATLVGPGSPSPTIDITLPYDGTATCTATLEAGYYVLTLTLEDITTPVPPSPFSKTIVTALRIIDGFPTTGDVYFDDPGGMGITITEDLSNPFNLVFTEDPDLVDPGAEILSLTDSDSMTVSVAPDVGTADTYVWYLNGVVIPGATSDSILINSISHPIDSIPFTVGFYNLTAIVTDSNGAICSDSITFTIDP